MKTEIDLFVAGLDSDEVIELQEAIAQKADEVKEKKQVELFLFIEKTMEDNGFKTKDLVQLEQLVKVLRKRRFTDGKGNFWSGRGKRPQWVHDELGEGGDIKTLRYDGDEYKPLNKR